MRFLRGFIVFRGGGPYPIMGYLGVRGIYDSLLGAFTITPDDPEMRYPTFAMSGVWASEAFFPFSR